MEHLLEAIVAAAVLWAALEDLLFRRIPNASVAVILVSELLALGWALSHGAGASDLSGAGTGALWALGILAVGFGLFLFGKMGAGDVKLAAALGLWLGADAPLLLIVMSLCGGLLVIGLPLLRMLEVRLGLFAAGLAVKTGRPLKRTPVGLLPDAERAGIPYGPAIAAGYFALLIHSHF